MSRRAREIALSAAARWFLSDLAQVAGFAGGRVHSSYVEQRPVLTAPDAGFFAGLAAVETSKVCDLFAPEEAGMLLAEIARGLDPAVGRRGTDVARVVFGLIGRLGYGAIVRRARIPDAEIGRVIVAMVGGKGWERYTRSATAQVQIRRGLTQMPPSWWREFLREARGQPRPAPRLRPPHEVLPVLTALAGPASQAAAHRAAPAP